MCPKAGPRTSSLLCFSWREALCRAAAEGMEAGADLGSEAGHELDELSTTSSCCENARLELRCTKGETMFCESDE